MKISRNWLQTYFKDPLPDAAALGDALTFHVFEIDGIEKVGGDDVLDVKVTANRGHDCLSHRGIAKELSAILNISLKSDPLREKGRLNLPPEYADNEAPISVSIQNPDLCARFVAGYIKGAKVGPSPSWLRERLESIGQRSINNVVDATNYVMFDLGQPLHAFDARKLVSQTTHSPDDDSLRGSYALTVRNAREGETMLGLDDKEYTLTPSMLVIADGNASDTPVSIAGIKGGKPTGIDDTTTDIILEAASWNGTVIRKTSQTLKLRTDASARFEQGIAAELPSYAMYAVAVLVQQIAGGSIVGVTDEYPKASATPQVHVSLATINNTLGTSFSESEVADAFRRLDFVYEIQNGTFAVASPFERLDILIPEDLIEEVGRIIGYDKIVPVELPALASLPALNERFYAAETIREELISQGYSEVLTSAFADKGERIVANKADGVRPYLRNNLTDGLTEAVKKNIPNKDLLGLKEVKLFEIGTIWYKDREEIVVAMASEKESAKQVPLSIGVAVTQYADLPLSSTLRYKSFSKYPYIVRDIALWTPKGTDAGEVLAGIKTDAGDLLVASAIFDRFEKGDKVSLAFRLIFQSFEKTLTDVEVNVIMETISSALRAQGFEIR
jgi:phenylalanyl-tRNA synthetase beta chain